MENSTTDTTTDTAATTTTNEPNVGIAFALVIGAGAATALGAGVVFFPRLVKLASRRTLAAALGLSAGVMTYVSFVEIFRKSWLAFVDAGFDEDREAYIYSTVCFFSGVVLMVAINAFVTFLLGGHHHHHDHPLEDEECGKRTGSISRDDDDDEDSNNGDSERQQHEGKQQQKQHGTAAEKEHQEDGMQPHCACCSEDPAGDLKEYQRMANEIETYEQREHHEWEGTTANATNKKKDEVVAGAEAACGKEDCTDIAVEDGDDDDDVPLKIKSGGAEEEEEEEDTQQHQRECCDEAQLHTPPPQDDENDQHSSSSNNEEDTDDDTDDHDENKKLMRMSVNTALAIGIHNFPEGLATFVAALSDPAVGVVLAVAIAIHNIPEGLCVAMPVYYATGNKWKAFFWGCLSGVSEPVAALLGWAVLANTMSNTVYAILFGLVAGMMVIISTKELLPTAHRYDPEDSVVTYAFMIGMAIMALSLVLFVL